MRADELLVPKPTPVASTYVAGDDPSRLRDAAAYLGLDRARRRTTRVREAVSILLSDTTLESARMHSVGTLASDERVDEGGTIHLMTLTRRRVAGVRPAYESGGDLMSIFEKPKEFAEGEVGGGEEEYEVVDTVEGGSLGAATFGIIKGTIGPAILFLPRGFKMAGWGVAIPALLFSTATYLYSAGRLLDCYRIEKRKIERVEEIKALLKDTESNYGAMDGASAPEAAAPRGPVDPHMPSADGTMLTYPELAKRAFGKYAVFVSAGIAVLQFGVCLTYFIFVPENLVAITRSLTGKTVSQEAFLIAMIFAEIPFTWIRDIRRLTPTNILASLLIFFGLASCLSIALFRDYGDSSLLKEIKELPPVNHETWFMFIGTAFYMFEGAMTLVVPLQEAVFTPEDKAKFPALNKSVMWCIVTFYCFFATTCLAAFGENLKTAMTASLPPGALATAVQVAYSIAVFFTFPLQIFPALEVTLQIDVKAGTTGHDYDSAIFRRNVKASFLVCCLGFIAYFAQDYLGNVASILGSAIGVPVALICPNMMHSILAKDASLCTRMMNYCVVCIGIIAFAVASTTTILNWSSGAEG